MAKYKKQKDGLFKTTVTTGKYDDNGKPIILHLSARSSAKLERKVGEIRSQLKLGTYADDAGKTFGAYARHWYHTYPEKLTETATHLKYKGIIDNHVHGISDMKLSQITKSDVQELINQADGHPDTQRMIKLTVSQILDSAIEDGLLYRNVCSKIHVQVPRQSDLHRPLTDDEKNAISELKKINSFTPMEQLFIDTLYVSGVRTEEALALTFDDVKNSQIDVNKALSWRGGRHIKTPKSNAGYRKIDVPQWYQTEVDEYHRDNPGQTYLFVGSRDKDSLSQSSYKAFWNGIYNKINTYLGGTPKEYYRRRVVSSGTSVTDITPYMFRHNYCTMLYYLQVDVKEAARIMGHSNVRITLEIYTHLSSSKSTIQEKVAGISL